MDQNGTDIGHKGIFTVEFDANHSLLEKKYFPFTEAFKSDYMIDKTRTSLNSMSILKSHITDKGELYLVLESSNVLFAMKESREDVTILKIKKGVGFEWTKRLRKYEIAGTRLWEYHLNTSVFFRNGILYLVYRDSPDNKTVFEPKPKEADISDETPLVRLVTVNETGNVDSKLITDSYFEESKCKSFWAIPANNKLVVFYKTPIPLTGNVDYNARKRHYAFRFYNLGQ